MSGFLDRLRGKRDARAGLSLDDYAIYLDGSHWKTPVEPALTRARLPQFLPPLKGVRAVIWDVYGTLLYCRHDGESTRFLEERPEVSAAFARTVDYFRMWPAMSKSASRGGAPGEYLRNQFRTLAEELLVEKGLQGRQHAEFKIEQVWERLLVRLVKGGFTFEAAMVGPPSAFAQKIALFADESFERTTLFPGAAETLAGLHQKGLRQGVAADGQVYTNAQLVKALVHAGLPRTLAAFFDPMLFSYSYEVSARRPDPALYQALVRRLAERGIKPHEALVVGNNLEYDVRLPANLGFRTALFAGDAQTVHPHDADFARAKPDAIVHEMKQVLQIV
jgi:putative hydrolase of the HAD superfamily